MKAISVRIPDDLAEEVEQYQKRHGLTQSQAVRRLLSDALGEDEQRQRLDEIERRVDRLEQRPFWFPW